METGDVVEGQFNVYPWRFNRWRFFGNDGHYAREGRGRRTPLYKPYRYVPPQRVGFLYRFSLKTDIDFAHFDLESDVVFEGTKEVYERVIVSILTG